MPGSGSASRMNADQVIDLMRRRAHALRTATRANFTERRRQLSLAVNIARAWRGANPRSSRLNDVNTTLRRVTYTLNQQEQRLAPSGRTARQMGKGGGGAAPASGGGRAPAAAPSGKGGGGGRAPSRAPSRAPAAAPVSIPGGDLPDTPDLGGAAGVGLFEAISRTFSGDVGPAGLVPMWNPPGPLLGRPAFKLFLLTSGLSIGTALTIWGVGKAREQRIAAAGVARDTIVG